jgi:hypothetical protein
MFIRVPQSNVMAHMCIYRIIPTSLLPNICNIIGSLLPRPMPLRLMPPCPLLVRIMPLGLLTRAYVIKAYAI